MTDLTFYTLDVFTTRPYGGNPLAVFPEGPDLSAAEMQLIANEIHLSETVFVLPPTRSEALRRLRIFTPDMELPFAGHPTIGTAQLLVELGIAQTHRDGTAQFVLEEAAGLVQVEVIPRQPTFTWLTTPQRPERGPDPPKPDVLAGILGLEAGDIENDSRDAPRAFSAGVPYVYVPIQDRKALARARVDIGKWRNVLSGFWAPHLYIFTQEAKENELFARMFAPAMGIEEDPATGAGVAGLAGYLWERDRRAGRWRISQGVEMNRPSELHLELAEEDGSLTSVRVGGSAVRMGSGTLRRPS